MDCLIYDRISSCFSIKSASPIPEPDEGEIRVKVYACALNPVDAKVANWIPKSMDEIVLGLDVCGEVHAVGSNVFNIKIGDIVLYHGRMFKGNGGFAEFAIHDALTCVIIPRDLVTDLNGELNKDLIIKLAASPCAAWTAYKAMYDQLAIPLSTAAPATPSGRIVIIGASGGVGSFCLQFGRMSRFKDIIAVCSKKHENYVISLGATHVIDYHNEDISAGLERLSREDGTGDGIDYAIDCVGPETAKSLVDHMAYGGKIIPLVSFADFGDIRCFMKSISICQLALGGGHNGGMKARLRLKEVGEIVTKLILQGDIQVPVTEILAGFPKLGEKLTEMVKANSTGKIVMSLLG